MESGKLSNRAKGQDDKRILDTDTVQDTTLSSVLQSSEKTEAGKYV